MSKEFRKRSTWATTAKLPGYAAIFRRNPTLVVALVASIQFRTGMCEVEYQYYDTFSVLSEPSFSIGDEQTSDDVLTEHVTILRDSVDRIDAGIEGECAFYDTNASVTWQTPDSLPVMYIYSQCGTRMEISFRDLQGQEWQKSKLVPLQHDTLKKSLEKLTGTTKSDLNADRNVQIARYAICKGVVPKPNWFKGSCE